jgi:predicted transcriptional regulator
MSFYTPNLERYEFFQGQERFISKLPEYEQNLVDYYLRRMTQKEIAKILQCTQGAVSSRLRKIVKRINFMRQLEEINAPNLEEDLKVICQDKNEIKLNEIINLEIIKGMIQTTSQSGTASIVNRILNLSGPERLNQVKVRHRFKSCLNKLRKLKRRFKYKPYFKLLELVDNNLYALNEIKLPHFDRGQNAK